MSPNAAHLPPSATLQKQAWIAIQIYTALNGLLLLLGAGSLLILLFPLTSLILGFYLYTRLPHFYLGFVLWLWLVSPFVRRLIDYQSGTLTPGGVYTTAGFVSLIALLTLGRSFSKLKDSSYLPFLACLVAILYGLSVAVVLRPIDNFGLIDEASTWLAPPLLGFHIYVNWTQYPQYRDTIRRCFFGLVLVMGVYGIYQFAVAPPWDRFYLQALQLSARGEAIPFGIRVWSTSEAPQTFATAMFVGLIILLVDRFSPLLWLSIGCGFLAFLLSLARAAWLGWAISMVLLLINVKPNRQAQIIFSAVIVALLLVPIASTEPFATVIGERFQTSENVQNDISLNARREGYNLLLGQALANPVGIGIGAPVDTGDTGYSISDGSILPLLYYLGWFGAIAYLFSILLLIFSLLKWRVSPADAFARAIPAIFLGLTATIVLNPLVNGSNGVVFWLIGSIGLASRRYYFNAAQSIKAAPLSFSEDSTPV